MTWFIIATEPNAERKASAELRRQGLRVYLPKRAYEVKNRRRGTVTVKRQPLLTGYLFVRFTEDMHDRRGVPQFGVVARCQGVRRFLCHLNEVGDRVPFSISGALVAEHMRRQRRREFDDIAQREVRRKSLYKRGRQMLVSDGPFDSFIATIQKLRETGQVQAEIDVFGRPVRIVFDNPDDQLKPIASKRKAA